MDMFDTHKYNSLAMSMLPSEKRIVLVEGNNKLFYQNIVELKKCFIQNGGSCESIKREVSIDKSIIGIIDRDYKNHTLNDSIFILDFYSVENIALMYLDKMDELRTILKDFFCKTELEEIQTKKIVGYFKYDKEKCLLSDFSIKISNTYHSQDIIYTQRCLYDEKSYLKYKRLKNVVESFVQYYKGINGRKNSIYHLEDLAQELPEASINYLFDDTTVGNLVQKIRYS